MRYQVHRRSLLFSGRLLSFPARHCFVRSVLQFSARERSYCITIGSTLLFPCRPPNTGLLPSQSYFSPRPKWFRRLTLSPSSWSAIQPKSVLPNDLKQKPTKHTPTSHTHLPASPWP